jgi:hypothetical protein
MQLPSPRENNRENIPAAPTGMTLRRDVPEVQQADEYVSRVSTWLKQAIDAPRGSNQELQARPALWDTAPGRRSNASGSGKALGS